MAFLRTEDVSNAVVLDIDYHESKWNTIDDYNRFIRLDFYWHHIIIIIIITSGRSNHIYTVVQHQKLVAVADQDGVLQVFSLKKGEIQLSFKTLPGPGISRLELGGAIGTVQDKIFVSSGNEVRGYTKKGKLFLAFDTNLTEPIKSILRGAGVVGDSRSLGPPPLLGYGLVIKEKICNFSGM
uniref:BBS7 beta-propeller domain-containing protein n=1 Tax=Timema cristinae TaxID=61476 RepID=A0A7R9H0K8_TIMCR|nr:unnamed protein product [Timema cristinae]